MDYNHRSDGSSDPAADDRVVFYIDDLSTRPESCQNPSPAIFQCGGLETPGLYPPETGRHPSRSNSVYSQSGRPRRSRTITDGDIHVGSRRASLHGARSRANSCTGTTPLGDGRRASVCRKNRPKRGSTVRRKGSIRANAGNNVVASTEVVKIAVPPIGNPVDIAQDRSRRKIVIIVLSIFIFLLVASILVVVITLTHSSFHSLPADPGKESDDRQDK